jgi:hypothetical protein
MATEAPMSDAAEIERERKNFWWNVMMFGFAAALLVVGVIFAMKFSKEGQPLKDTIQLMTLTIVVPGFIFLAAADKVPKETAGALISALIGFAIGKIVE